MLVAEREPGNVIEHKWSVAVVAVRSSVLAATSTTHLWVLHQSLRLDEQLLVDDHLEAVCTRDVEGISPA